MADGARPSTARKTERQRPGSTRTPTRPPTRGARRTPHPPPASSIVAAEQRFSSPRQRVSRRVVKVVAWVAVAVAVAGAAWGLAMSPLLQVHTVDVAGVEGPAQTAVRSAASGHLGTPLLRVDTEQVAATIQGSGTYESVRVSRSWPQTLRVDVVPRTPAVQIRTASGGYEVFDRHGEKYQTSASPVSGIPVAVVKHPEDPEAVRAGVATMQAVPEQWRSEVRDVTVNSPVDVRFNLGAIAVVWGGPDEGETKARVVSVLRKRSGVTTIDVSSPGMPVTS